MGNDARDGVAATLVLAEDLGEEAPDGADGTEHPVAVLDVVLGQDLEDAGLGQDVSERQPLVVRKSERGTSFRVVIGRPPMSFSDRFVRVARTRDPRGGSRAPRANGDARRSRCSVTEPEQNGHSTGMVSYLNVLRLARPKGADRLRICCARTGFCLS